MELYERLLKKKPHWLKLIKYYKNEESINIYSLTYISWLILNYDFKIKEQLNPFTINDPYSIFEKKILKMVNQYHSDKIIKKVFSNSLYNLQHSSLLNNAIIKTYYQLNKVQFNSYIKPFIATCTSNLRCLSFLQNSVLWFKNWNKDFLKERLTLTKYSDIILETNNAVIVQCQNSKDMQLLGSPSWCISRTEESFNNYVDNYKQFLIYNFKLSPENPNSLIGITINDNLFINVIHCFDKLNNPINQYSNLIPLFNKIIYKKQFSIIEYRQNVEKLPSQVDQFIAFYKMNMSYEAGVVFYQMLSNLQSNDADPTFCLYYLWVYANENFTFLLKLMKSMRHDEYIRNRFCVIYLKLYKEAHIPNNHHFVTQFFDTLFTDINERNKNIIYLINQITIKDFSNLQAFKMSLSSLLIN